ncbi:hypothetical protein [uncultured Massilia sp.]|uniref:hypothetical protein n=1 Tax=uncultured Massilia sp. TaxID=169973 RepID=UPI0025DC8CC0|nr:hypothetical protein [uncultured Massilia sp.]
MKVLFGWLFLACLLLGCGDPDQGPPLGDFPAITKTAGDAPFTLTAPSSRSPAAFTFTSSNPAVATIEGATVTIRGAGTSTITAAQSSHGSYGPTSTSTTLTVTGAPACTAPATAVNGACVAPASSAASFPSGGLIWYGVTRTDTWTNADAFCKTSIIDSVAGWRQPTAAELGALRGAGAAAGRGWTLGATWASDGAAAGQEGHAVVDLASGATAARADTATAYVSCVH